MATVAEKYGMPKFIPMIDASVVQKWATEASEKELIVEHRAMRSVVDEFPRYSLLLARIEMAADIRGIELFAPLVSVRA